MMRLGPTSRDHRPFWHPRGDPAKRTELVDLPGPRLALGGLLKLRVESGQLPVQAIEQARTLSVLLDDLWMTSAVLAIRIGRSRADNANTMRRLDLPDEVVEMIDSGALTKATARCC